MKKLLSVVLASLIAVPSVFGVNQTVIRREHQWKVRKNFDSMRFKNDSYNNCVNEVVKFFDEDFNETVEDYRAKELPIPLDEVKEIVDAHVNKRNECERVYKSTPRIMRWVFAGGGVVIDGVLTGIVIWAWNRLHHGVVAEG